MNDNVSLETQNFERFAECKQLNQAPLKAEEVINDPTCIISGKKHIIFVEEHKQPFKTNRCNKNVGQKNHTW